MDGIISRLNVYFEEPFWVGVFERTEQDRMCACRVVFGAEPKDAEIYELILKRYVQLRYSPTVETTEKPLPANPKRLQRAVRRQLESTGRGTRSQQALQLQREQLKTERKQFSRQQREAELERRFAQKQQKRKEKHRGR